MKATAKIIELDGSAQEIASVLAGVMGTTVTLEPAAPVALPEPPPPAYRPVPTHTPMPSTVDDVDEPSASVIPIGTPRVPTGRYREWQDIPADVLVWNAVGTVAHIAKAPNDPYTTWCGHDVGRVRAADMEPRSVAAPCGNCNRRIDEAASKEGAA